MDVEDYECMNPQCKHKYQEGPRMTINGPSRMTQCPRCNGIYVKWVSFETKWKYDEQTNRWMRK